MPPPSESLGGQQLSLLSRFGRRGIVLLTLGLVGPCGVGGAAAGSSTGIMALRFLLGFLLAGVDLGVYLMRKWYLSLPWVSSLIFYISQQFPLPLGPRFQLSRCPGLLKSSGRGPCCFSHCPPTAHGL